ncbi:hypothetical protein BS78_02G088200 [Paspalum vaginatum]|nr:hypothetical protein BS78_02G088200 [Paspalum vaginatum]
MTRPPSGSTSTPLMDNDIYHAVEEPVTGFCLGLVIDSTPSDRTATWRSARTVAKSEIVLPQQLTQPPFPREGGGPACIEMVCNLESPSKPRNKQPQMTTASGSTLPDSELHSEGSLTLLGDQASSEVPMHFSEVLVIGMPVEDDPVSGDEPSVNGETPHQCNRRRRRNRQRNIRRHHNAGNQDPTLPVSQDEATDPDEMLEQAEFRRQRNSRRRDRRHMQDQQYQWDHGGAAHDVENHIQPRPPLPAGHNLLPNFAVAMGTPSQAGGVLARLADTLPQTPNGESYRRIFAQAAHHLLPAVPPAAPDARQAINERRDVRNNIERSRAERHTEELRHRNNYDHDFGAPHQEDRGRANSARAFVNSSTARRSVRDRLGGNRPRSSQRLDPAAQDGGWYELAHHGVVGIPAFTTRLREVAWPQNFKVSNVDKHDCSDNWDDFCRPFIANFQSLSDKPVQPWDLKSIKRKDSEGLRSYLKRFQSMRNRIPNIADAVVIDDFFRGSRDEAFVEALLPKSPVTSEQLFCDADRYITVDERARDLVDAQREERGKREESSLQDRRWEKRPREEIQTVATSPTWLRVPPRQGGQRSLDQLLDAPCPYHNGMHRTLRDCRDFKALIAHGRPFVALPPASPLPRDQRPPPQQNRGSGAGFPNINRHVNVIFGGHGSQESKQQQKL